MPRIMVRYLAAMVAVCALVMWPARARAQGRQGEITSLAANNAPNPGDSICVSTVLHSLTKVQESSLYLQIVAPDGTAVVASRTTAVPDRLKADAYWTYTWCLQNTGFPATGHYSVYACWSTGRATNCNIAQATTAFYSVPTLGVILMPLLVAIMALVLWRQGRPHTDVPKATI